MRFWQSKQKKNKAMLTTSINSLNFFFFYIAGKAYTIYKSLKIQRGFAQNSSIKEMILYENQFIKSYSQNEKKMFIQVWCTNLNLIH